MLNTIPHAPTIITNSLFNPPFCAISITTACLPPHRRDARAPTTAIFHFPRWLNATTFVSL